MNQSHFKTYLRLFSVMAFWGLAFGSARILGQKYDPFSVSFLRFFLASVVLVTLFFRKNHRFYRITGTQFFKVLSLAATGVFSYNYFFFSGLRFLEAGRASVIIAINPILINLFAIIFLRETFTWRKIGGAILAFCGVLVVLSRGNAHFLSSTGIGQGEYYIFGAVLSWVSYTLLGKLTLKKISPFEAATWASFLGCLLLFPFAYQSDLLIFLQRADIYDWLHIANLGLLSTCFGFIWYYEGVREIGASRASSFINLVPFFGILSGIIFLDEIPSLSLIFGGLVVVIGVFLVNRKERLNVRKVR